MPRLVVPDRCYHRSFSDAVSEFLAEGVNPDHYRPELQEADHFEEWLTVLEEEGRPDAQPRFEGWVPQSTLWWIDDAGEYIGRVAIRHRLTEPLLQYGGHIGYDVRSSRRREGHATAMLAASLPFACDLGIERALVTCDHDNVGSRKVIEANGGVPDMPNAVKLRYWVGTSAG